MSGRCVPRTRAAARVPALATATEDFMNAPTSTTEKGKTKEEGHVTTAIEEQTAKLGSGSFLALAIGSMALSAGLMAADKKQIGNFIGQWAPTLLIMGLYNKVVKIEHDLLEA